MNQEYFNILLKLAKKASKKDEVPISALIVQENKIIAKAYNKRNKSHFIGDHAEIIALKIASKKLKRWHLSDCELYVTLKPCNMCSSAINQARIKNVYYLLDNLEIKKEYSKTKYTQTNIRTINAEYSHILRDFFRRKRDKKRDI